MWSCEITGALLRNAAFGEPYTATITVLGDEGTATVKGLTSPAFTRADWDAVCAELRRLGFSTLRFSRHKPGGVRWVTRPL